MREFTVDWSIDVSAETKEEAVLEAKRAMCRRGTTATFFGVVARGSKDKPITKDYGSYLSSDVNTASYEEDSVLH